MVDPILSQRLASLSPTLTGGVPSELTLTARAAVGLFRNLPPSMVASAIPAVAVGAKAATAAAGVTVGTCLLFAASATAAIAAAGVGSHYISQWWFQKSFEEAMRERLRQIPVQAPGPAQQEPMRDPLGEVSPLRDPALEQGAFLLNAATPPREAPIGDPVGEHQAIGDPSEFKEGRNPLDMLTEEDWELLKSGREVHKQQPWDGLVTQVRFVPLKDEKIRVERNVAHKEPDPPPRQALLLDDRAAHREKGRRFLEGTGFEVTTARTLKEAQRHVLERIGRGTSFDVIVTDLDLGPKLKDKLHALDGIFFVKWLANGIVPSPVLLHSTLFDGVGSEMFMSIARFLVGRHPNVAVQPKRILFGHLYALTPPDVAAMRDWQKVGFAIPLAEEMRQTGRELLQEAIGILHGSETDAVKKQLFNTLRVTGERRIRHLRSLQPRSEEAPYRSIFGMIGSSMGNGLVGVSNGFQFARDTIARGRPLESAENYLTSQLLPLYQEKGRVLLLEGQKGVRVDTIRYELLTHLLGRLKQNSQGAYFKGRYFVFEGLARRTRGDAFLPDDFWPLKSTNLYIRAFEVYLGFPIAVDPERGMLIVDLGGDYCEVGASAGGPSAGGS